MPSTPHWTEKHTTIKLSKQLFCVQQKRTQLLPTDSVYSSGEIFEGRTAFWWEDCKCRRWLLVVGSERRGSGFDWYSIADSLPTTLIQLHLSIYPLHTFADSMKPHHRTVSDHSDRGSQDTSVKIGPIGFATQRNGERTCIPCPIIREQWRNYWTNDYVWSSFKRLSCFLSWWRKGPEWRPQPVLHILLLARSVPPMDVIGAPNTLGRKLSSTSSFHSLIDFSLSSSFCTDATSDSEAECDRTNYPLYDIFVSHSLFGQRQDD